MASVPIKRSRELKPLSSEHHQALLVSYQLRRGLAGHGDTAGAPRDVPGLLALARRFEEATLRPHARAEEELLAQYLPAADARRLSADHAELRRLLDQAGRGGPPEARQALSAFAELLERHVRWEERELFPAFERAVGEAELADIGHELEKRLVLQRADQKASAKRA
jgi:hypothetical protein